MEESLDFTATHLSNILFLLQERKEHHIIGYTIRKHRIRSTCVSVRFYPSRHVKAKNSLLDKPSKAVPDTDEIVFSPF